MTKRLEGKVALVTGASKGIGAEIAARLAAEGAAVAVNYSASKEAAARVVAAITAKGGKAVAVHGNLTDAGQVKSVVAETVKAFGPIDILINNAGLYEFAALDGITPEHFHKHFDLNVLGLLLVSQEAIRHFKDGGSIVNISSGVSTLAPPNSAVYTATKAAVDAISSVLSKELAPRKIRVNTVNPGMVKTPLSQRIWQAWGIEQTPETMLSFEAWFARKVAAAAPLGRPQTPEDIANMVVFLASGRACQITGQILNVDGGQVMGR